MNTTNGIKVTAKTMSIYSSLIIMVKLPPHDQPIRDADRGARTSRNNWRGRVSRRDGVFLNPEPRGLLELEALARRSVSLMEKYSPKSDKNFDKAMDLLRTQYNLNFLILCENCNEVHNMNDELIAPER